MAETEKSKVLLVGSGGVGTIMAYNLELGGQASVSCVLRSNYKVVEEKGFDIDSVDYGKIKSWKPTKLHDSIPKARDDRPFDFIVCTTKNIADVPPTLTSIIAPAVTPRKTAIVLAQNGLNIEKPILAAFPENAVVSGIVLMGAHELRSGVIVQDDKDIMRFGPFADDPNDPQQQRHMDGRRSRSATEEFIRLYSAAGVARCELNLNVGYERWRKLIYNSSWNPVCAVLGMDTSRLRLSGSAVEDLIRPAMEEIKATAAKLGFELPEDVVQATIDIDPIEVFLKPSMQVDVEKGNYIEYENILGEPLREAEKAGVPTPTLKVLYGMCKALQWRTMERRGLIKLPGKE